MLMRITQPTVELCALKIQIALFMVGILTLHRNIKALRRL